MRAIREKSLSNVKRLARCSSAIAAIKVSIVVRLMPLARAAREIADASRYVEKPPGSIISHCERYRSIRGTSRLRPWRISEITTPVSTKGSASSIIRRNSLPARPGEELKKSIQTDVSTRIKSDSGGFA